MDKWIAQFLTLFFLLSPARMESRPFLILVLFFHASRGVDSTGDQYLCLYEGFRKMSGIVRVMSGHSSQFPCILPSYLVQVPVTPLYEEQRVFSPYRKKLS